MFPPAFSYHRPGSVQEAVQILGANPDAKVLAGGHSLIPAMKLRLAAPGALVDIGRIAELKGVQLNGGATIGATATYDEIRDAPGLVAQYPILGEAINVIGDQQVRARGTMGGALAHADPAADLTAVFLAIGGEVTVVGPNGERTVPADELFVDLWTCSIEPEEIITSIRLAAPPANAAMAYEKHSHPASGYAVVGVAVVLGRGDGDRCESARVAITGATSTATRAGSTEEALTGASLDDATIASAADVAADGMQIHGDLYASEEYRAHLVKVLTRRALKRAVGRP
ncbi:MAG: xanthine dehydrogenase family protein subunit M [Chloroflexota bacterium]|nr:xanthine dehydrogenase family protein subunit M [Chloroflexota bacterium]